MAFEDNIDLVLEHVFSDLDAGQLSPDVVELRNVLCSRTLHATIKLRELYDGLSSQICLGNDVIEDIQSYVEDMIRFAKATVSGLFDKNDDAQYINCLVSIFNPVMMSCLLHLRQSLLGPANKELESLDSNEDSDGVITWVDVLLALLGEMALRVAGGAFTSNSTAVSLPAGLHTQKQEENIRTASQLPSSLRLLPDVLRSNQCSPSLKRLSLCFLFAAIVVKTDLTECDPWSDTEFVIPQKVLRDPSFSHKLCNIRLDPSHLSECLEFLIGEYSAQAQMMSTSDTCFVDTASQTHRPAFSMLLVLYSTANMLSQDRSLAPFRPHTEAQLLVLTRAALSLDDSKHDLIVPNLDPCHRILFKWGCFVPWSWSTWDDPRLLQLEQKALTATWLCHLEETFLLSREEDPVNPCDLWPDTQFILKAAVAINPVSSFIAFSAQVKHTIDGLKEGPMNNQSPEGQESNSYDTMRLFRVVWCLAHLVSDYSAVLPSPEVGIVCERLLGLYGLLEGSASGTKVKAEIVRCLTYMEKETVRKSCSARDVGGDSARDSFTGGLAHSIGCALRSETPLASVSDHASQLALVVLLDMVSLLCKCHVTAAGSGSGSGSGCLPAPTSSLLAKLVKELSLSSTSPAAVDDMNMNMDMDMNIQIRISLLNCLASARKFTSSSASSSASVSASASTSASGSSGSHGSTAHWHGLTLPRSCTDEAILNLALRVRGTHRPGGARRRLALALAAALASYAAVSIRKSTDALLVAEVWDYLCDTLIFYAANNQRNVPHTESESESDVEQICEGLVAVLARSDAKISSYLLSSPLTLSFVNTLKHLPTSANVRGAKAFEGLFEKMHKLCTMKRN